MATTRDNQHEARRADSAQRRFQFGLVWFRRVGGLVMPPCWLPQKKVGQRMLSIILSPYPAYLPPCPSSSLLFALLWASLCGGCCESCRFVLAMPMLTMRLIPPRHPSSTCSPSGAQPNGAAGRHLVTHPQFIIFKIFKFFGNKRKMVLI